MHEKHAKTQKEFTRANFGSRRMLDIRKRFQKWNLAKYSEEEGISRKHVERDLKASLWQKWATNAKHFMLIYYSEKILHYS